MIDDDKPKDGDSFEVRPVDLNNFLVDFEHQWKVDGGNMIYGGFKGDAPKVDFGNTTGQINLTAVQDPTRKEQDGWRWLTAIQKVSPKSGPFWYDYGRKYDEKVLVVVTRERNPHGYRCCDIQVYTKRPIGEVVQTAWNEYNKYLVKG